MSPSSNNLPLVSIILPVFNVEKYLEESLESILSQDYPMVEVVAINDGSTDGSRNVLAETQREVGTITILDQPNRGLAAARNAGLDAATGEYVMFVDADDRIAPDAVRKCLEFAVAHHLEAVTFDGETFGSVKNLPSPNLKKEVKSGVYSGAVAMQQLLIQSATWVCTPLFFFNRTFLNKASLRFCEGILHEDVEFTPRALLAMRRIGVLKENLYFYRVGRAGAITSDLTREGSEKQLLAIYDRLYSASESSQYSSETRHLLEQYLINRYLMLLAGTLGRGNARKLRRKAAYDVVKNLHGKSRLWRGISLEKRKAILETYLLPEIRPITKFASKRIFGPARRFMRYQLLQRLRRLRF